MAASSEHGSARIKIQVVATLLPLNIPVHVDPFWVYVRFTESPKICDVENKIITSLNHMGAEYPPELVVHDSPITPAWTYLPTGYVASSSSLSHLAVLSKKSMSISDASEQDMSIVLRPLSAGISKAKPSRPVLIRYEISQHICKPVRIVFKKQLVFMHDSVLLSGSQSDILRDNDVVTINAICYLSFMKDIDNPSEVLGYKQMKASPDVECDAEVFLQDLDEDGITCDAETHSRTVAEASLLPDIKSRIDTLLKKLASLQHVNQTEKSTSKSRKAKKRKTDERDSESESSSTLCVISDKVGAHHETKKKANGRDKESAPNNSFVALFGERDIENEKQKKGMEYHQPIEDHYNSNDVDSENNVLSKSKKKKKKSKTKMKSDTEIDNFLDRNLTEPTKENCPVSQIFPDIDDQVDHIQVDQVQDDQVQVDQVQDDQVQVDQVQVDQVQVDQVQVDQVQVDQVQVDQAKVDPATNISVPPVPLTPAPKKRKKFINYGLSNLLSALRKQEACDSYSEGKKRSEMINPKVEKQESDHDVPETIAATDFANAYNQVNSAETGPKRKRVRKRKKKNLSLEKAIRNIPISETIKRDFTLKLPEHQMPQNNRVTFECDSDDDDNGVEAINQHAAEDVLSAPLLNKSNHSTNGNNVASLRQDLYQSEEKHKSANQSAARSDLVKSLFAEAGASINPNEKFEALLHQCGRMGRQFETVDSGNGHTVIRSSRKHRNSYKSAMSDTVDPNRDVLTNVSMVTQYNSEVKNPSSDSIRNLQPLSSTTEDSLGNLSLHVNHKSQNTQSSSTPTPGLKSLASLVEVTPLYMNYSSCEKLCEFPKEGDIIAYKILELADDYTPGLSDFKEAKVIQVDVQTEYLLLEPRGGNDNKKRFGRFELNIQNDKKTVNIGANELVSVSLADLVDTRIVFRTDGSQ